MSTRSRPPTLLEYLIEQGFAPVAEGTWFDRDTTDGTIRVVHEAGDDTQLISLAPRGVCRYKAMFSTGTPDAVIIAAVRAAIRQQPGPGGGAVPGRPGTAGPGTTHLGSMARRKGGRR